ncbi:MAG: XRE family transcriptional regulator [Cyanobacteria bacterium REEB65]|nr:XRE family transcriptional regulator [Cyanobacteria bacterium REEB65]
MRRGLTKAALAERAGTSLRSIASWEGGECEPSEASLKTLAQALAFPAAFFLGGDLEAITPEGVSFRALSRMKAAQRDRAIAGRDIAYLIDDWLSQRFSVPAPQVPNCRGHSPVSAAAAVQAAWALGDQPIPSMVHLLEAKGVRVFSLAEDCAEVDAFSCWRSTAPYVFLNTKKTAEHSRFDAAHELGHLVLHAHGDPRGREAEHEADAFAGAFLMAEASVRAAMRGQFPSVSLAVQMKKIWRVSVGALVHRWKDLGFASEWHYRNMCIEIQNLGYRKSEPQGIEREVSQVFFKVLQALEGDGMSRRDIAKDLHLPPSEVEALTFGKVAVAGGRVGNAPAEPGERPTLRVLSNGRPLATKPAEGPNYR